MPAFLCRNVLELISYLGIQVGQGGTVHASRDPWLPGSNESNRGEPSLPRWAFVREKKGEWIEEAPLSHRESSSVS